jgi:hypothetical protein
MMKSTMAIYVGLEFEADGYPALALINKDLKQVQLQQMLSHAVFIELVPDKTNELGLPDAEEYEMLNSIEQGMIEYMEEVCVSAHVGHVTRFRLRQIIFYTAKPELVEDYLPGYLENCGRTASFTLEPDPGWEQVSGFYDQV